MANVQAEFQVDGAETGKDRDETLLLMPYGLSKKFVLEKRKDLDGR